MHGVTKGSGAPSRNQNAIKRGLSTKSRAVARHVQKLLRDGRRLIQET